ncbi:MAG: hypothetical protein ACK4UN_21325 [Limisphaerales bacterium]
MGTLFILPVAAIAAWIIYSSFRTLRRGEVSPVWRSRVVFLLVVGVLLGAYFAFGRKSQPTAHFAVEGFPIPTTIHRLENDVWKSNNPPLPIFVASKITNFFFGVALALLPLKAAGLINQAKTPPPPSPPKEG